ncbi:hypothetical protein [Nodosilinea nodulosa]|uniref:hypothetical protein n=1 Tax=Nodosilinea nodulosa TaxID=416001 RepID=UPI0002F5087E|nr:hypothetical protein [Nodosilinea nodulosa]
MDAELIELVIGQLHGWLISRVKPRVVMAVALKLAGESSGNEAYGNDVLSVGIVKTVAGEQLSWENCLE